MEEYEVEKSGGSGDSEDDKLKLMKEKFQDSVDHHAKAHAMAHRCMRFYHNTNNKGQWDPEDLAALEDQGRVAFTFNLIKPKVKTLVGMYGDSQRYPKVAGTGDEDKLLAETVNTLVQKLMKDAKHEQKAGRVFNFGTAAGECSFHIEVVPDHRGHGWLKVNLHRVLAYEVHWDIASVEPDRSDANHFFWDRWLSKGDFSEAYPDHKEEWSKLAKQAGSTSSGEWAGDNNSEMGAEVGGLGGGFGGDDSISSSVASRYYYDRNKRQARVVHYEYKEWIDVFYVVDTRTGQRSKEIGKEQVEQIEFARDAYNYPVDVEKSRKEVVKVCEFMGGTILREYDQAGPFEGFSVIPYCYEVDEETGTATGYVQDLIDPQMEFNKGKSLEIEHAAQRVTTGAVAEKDAITDEDQFSDAMRQPGGVAYVENDALSAGRVQVTDPQAPDPTAAARQQNAADILSEISGIPPAANFSPAEQAQSGMTVALRHHKSKQTVQDAFANFEGAQESLFRKVAEIVTRAMPDDQIETILADESRLRVGNGFVVEMVQGPGGQMVPGDRVEIRDMRGIDCNLELEHKSGNNTLRMIEFDLLMTAGSAGVPVPPDLVAEAMFESKAKQERMKKFLADEEKSQADQSRMESESFQAQQMQALQLEASKAQEAARHNQTEEQLKSEKQDADAMLELVKVVGGLEADEQKTLIEQAKLLVARNTGQQGASV